MMHPFHVLLILFGVLCLVALVLLLRWESRHYDRLGKHAAWLRVRLATVPIALATAALVIVPARSTSGMEGLAVLYGLLLVIAPIFWFGAHWIVGKFGGSAWSAGESAQVAGSPILLVVMLSAIAHMLQPIAWKLLRAIGLT